MNPGDAQQRAQSELQSGESIYWTGTADPSRAALSALPAALFGIPFAGFSLFWINGAYQASTQFPFLVCRSCSSDSASSWRPCGRI
jgi:hypothetical protein